MEAIWTSLEIWKIYIMKRKTMGSADDMKMKNIIKVYNQNSTPHFRQVCVQNNRSVL
jgi:hypothetical protein